SGRVASRLRSLGVGPEDRVGVCLRRRPGLVAALLGVLEAGAAYVPLDPAYPEERLRFLLEDAGVRALITERELRPSLAFFSGATALLEDLLVEGESPSGVPIHPSPTAGNLAYLIYTSGSTGRPKGVGIEHRSAVALVRWALAAFSAEELAGVLAATSVCFDLSVFELFAPLAAGGAVVLAENALALPRAASQARITLVNTVPSALAEILAAGALPASVRAVNLAGEALPGALVAAIFAAGPGVDRVLNLYGPSEDTTYSTGAVFLRAEEGTARAAQPPIGLPLPGTQAYVLGGHGELLPVGVPGELHLAGAGLARGYLGRPELTAERFVPDAWSGRPGGRLYRTGDLARWRAAGEIEFLGRIDHQVKVRGFRIEPGEVEACLLEHPAVREAVVVGRRDEGETRLVAYVAPFAPPGQPGSVTADALRGHCASRLPGASVPAFFVLLPALPRTPNGKVDRRALPAVDEAALRDRPAAAPRTAFEARLASLWRDVLGVAEVGVEDDFFALGGHSLLAARLVARMRRELGVELPLARLLAAPSVAGVARTVAAAEAIEAAEAVEKPAPSIHVQPAASARPADGVFPLSFAQERIWFFEQLAPGSPAYHLAGGMRLAGPLSVPALAAALGATEGRHEALRSRFLAGPAGPFQRVEPSRPMRLPQIDLAALAASRREAEAERAAAVISRRPFDLAAEAPFLAALLRAGPESHALVASLHHIAADGWSLGILLGEWAAHYSAALAGAPDRLPRPALQLGDLARDERERLAAERLAELFEAWRQALAGAPLALDLAADRPRPAVRSLRGERVDVALPEALGTSLPALARAHGVSPFMVLFASFSALLARRTGLEDLLVGSPIANRDREETQGVIGCLVNLLPLRGDLSGDPPFVALLARARTSTLAAQALAELPFEKLVEDLVPERDLSRPPLVQAVLSLAEAAPRLDLPGIAAEAFLV
ncbi:MAG TPA: amino acid adenylation domain-containing protein, partial [Thermoanaerobaculia bacterium]|nr:amino acid adenylation domain-containing protein [Thermoanaerobaculia bacterium]